MAVVNGQSFFDLSVQEAGTVESAVALALANGYGITQDLEIGKVLKIVEGNKNVADFFSNNKIKVVTGASMKLPAAIMNIAPTALSFTNTEVGTTKTVTFIITNTGTATLEILSITLPFATYTSSFSSGSILPSESQVVTISYTPTSAGTQNGTVVVNSNVGSQNVTVLGSGFLEVGTNFNGVANYLKTNSAITLPSHNSNFTYSYLVRTGVEASISAAQVLQMCENTDNSHTLGFFGGVGELTFYKINAGQVSSVRSATPFLFSNTLYKIQVVNSGSTASDIKIYINGTEIALDIVQNDTLANVSPSSPILFSSVGGSNFFFMGNLYRVRLYNKALSLSELAAEKDAVTPLPSLASNLIHAWELQDAQNSNTRVASAGGVDITLQNYTTGERAAAQRDKNNNVI